MDAWVTEPDHQLPAQDSNSLHSVSVMSSFKSLRQLMPGAAPKLTLGTDTQGKSDLPLLTCPQSDEGDGDSDNQGCERAAQGLGGLSRWGLTLGEQVVQRDFTQRRH